MKRHSLAEGRGYRVGERLVLSCGPADARIVGITPTRFLVQWPWLEIDPELPHAWDGTMGFSRDPEAYDWRNTPWRVEPDGWEVTVGDPCFVGIPRTEVQVTTIERYEPPGMLGWLPRPEWIIEVRPVEFIEDEEAGYVLYPDSGEPIVIEHVVAGAP